MKSSVFASWASLWGGMIVLAGTAAAAPGDLDLSFGSRDGSVSNGIALGPPSFPRSVVFGLAEQSDGKIVGAASQEPVGNIFRFAVVRWRANGELDSDFGAGGIVVPAFGDYAYATAVTVLSDGRIVAAGAGGAPPGDWNSLITVARFLPDGSPDVTFGTAGSVMAGTPGEQSSATALSILSDGKILVAGMAYGASESNTLVYRFHADGSVDTSFGAGGHIVLPGTVAFGMKVQNDGKIVLAGLKPTGSNFMAQLWLARCDAGGTLDPSFGDAGTLLPPAIGTGSMARGLALQDDGKIVVTGHATFPVLPFGDRTSFLTARFLPDGRPDATFNGTGAVLTNLPSPPYAGSRSVTDSANAVTVQPDGKILAGGESYGRFGLVRYHPDGSLDTGFNDDGMVTTDTAGIDDTPGGVFTLLLQRDGKILAGGRARIPFPGGEMMALARYHGGEASGKVALEWPVDAALPLDAVVELGSRPRGNPATLATVVTLRNTGATALSGISATIQGSAASAFSVTSPPSVLSPGATASLTVNFTTPPVVSSLQAGLLIRGSDPNEILHRVKVHGATDLPVARLSVLYSGQSLDGDRYFSLGPARAAPAVTTRSLTLKNAGNIDLTLQGFVFPGSNAADFSITPPANLVLAPNATVPLPVNFSPSSGEWQSTVLRIISTDTFELAYDVNVFGWGASPLEVWRDIHFGSLLNEGTGADLNDPDHDGISNLVEYATLTNPSEPNAQPGQVSMNGDRFEYTIRRPGGTASYLTYAAEWSDTAGSGSWTSVGVQTTILSDDGASQNVKFSIPAAGTRRFMRLQVSRFR